MKRIVNSQCIITKYLVMIQQSTLSINLVIMNQNFSPHTEQISLIL